MDDKEFLKELQSQCFKEAVDYLAGMRDGLLTIQSDPVKGVSDILRSLHSLKGNLQAVGFLHCAKFAHEIETALTEIETHCGPNMAEAELLVLEFLISDVVHAAEFYLKDLESGKEDSEELKSLRGLPLDLLTGWKPATPCSKITPIAPTPVEPEEPFFESLPVPTSALESVAPAEVAAPTAVDGFPTEGLYLLCKLSSRDLAIPIQNVVEIIRARNTAPLPTEQKGIAGMINLRGEAMLVLDPSTTLGTIFTKKETHTRSALSYIVICQLKQMQFGFEVDEAQQVIFLKKDSFQKIQGSENPAEVLSVSEGKTIMMIDLNRVEAA